MKCLEKGYGNPVFKRRSLDWNYQAKFESRRPYGVACKYLGIAAYFEGQV